MASNIFLVVWIIWVIALLVLYHKVFEVYYFSLSNGLMKELITAIFVGAIMTALTFYLWWITAIIIIVIGLVTMGKVSSKAPLIVAIILAIVVAIIGSSFRSAAEESNNSTSAKNHYEYVVNA